MKICVSRTSLWDNDIPPIDGAVFETLQVWDVRFANDPKSVYFYGGADDWCYSAGADDWWYSVGEDHGHDEDGNIRRKILRDVWTLEIESIEKFIRDNGTCVVNMSNTVDGLLSFEIYDDYRE